MDVYLSLKQKQQRFSIRVLGKITKFLCSICHNADNTCLFLDDPKIAGTYIGCIYGNTVNEFVCSYVERDMQKEQEQLDEIKYFWDTYILGNQKPDYSGKSETDLKIQRRFSGSADKNAPAD